VADRAPGNARDQPSNDGGASAAELPQVGLAVPDRVKSSVPPFATNDYGSHGLVEAAPSTFRLWM
jgi:hypothetical protein